MLIPYLGHIIQVTVLFKCRGDTKHAMAYRLARLSAQMVLACLAGIGASLVPGAAGALALVTSALGVQLLVFLWITCLCPSIDRIDNAVQVLPCVGKYTVSDQVAASLGLQGRSRYNLVRQ